MAVFQAVDAFRLFTGVEPSADRMLAHFGSLADAPESDVRVG
jgi:shikimate dehydrogenase